VLACEMTYRSFRAFHCRYTPNRGPRLLCRNSDNAASVAHAPH
jgi:hypothetical protein